MRRKQNVTHQLIARYCLFAAFAMGIHAHHQRPRRTLSARSLGMLILTALLCGNVIPASSIEGICDILISKMGMLFLPAGVSVILYVDVIKAELLPITVTIVVCSIVVLALTAFFIEAMLKGKESQ